jgi:hypothetical protein
MKRKIAVGISFIILTLTFNSCEPLGTCKICREVTYEVGGGVISEGPEAEYCDAELIAIEAKDDIIIGNKRYSWECR